MRVKRLIMGVMPMLLLTACNFAPSPDSSDNELSSGESSSSEHIHSYDKWWEYDETYHWHDSTCGHEVVGNKEKHTFKDEITPPNFSVKGYTTHTCTVCGYYYRDNEIDELPHNYSSEWDYDEKSHWQDCIDEGYESWKTGENKHDYVKSDDGNGMSCSICGYSYDYGEFFVFRMADDKKSYVINDCSSSLEGNIVIPSVHNGLPVTAIDHFGLTDNTFSVVIPPSVTSIGSNSFSGCHNLSSIEVDIDNPVYDSRDNCNAIIETATNTLIAGCKNTVIPDSVTSIADSAFSNCGYLESIEIPAGVISIGKRLFSTFNSLASIKVDPGNKVYDSRNDCNAIIETATNTLITGCKGTVIPDSVTSIGDYAFYGSLITSLLIPDSVISVGYDALSDCPSLDYKDVGQLRYLGNAANPYRVLCCVIDEASIVKATVHKDTKVIADGAFSDCRYLASVSLPEGISSIGEETFNSCGSLTSVTIPAGVVSIGDYAFEYCGSLVSVTIPDSVVSIGDYAFLYCKSLASISIPASVVSIGKFAFDACESLASVTLLDIVDYIGYGAFSRCGITDCVVFEGLRYLGNDDNPYLALYSVSDVFIDEAVIHHDTKMIMYDAFRSCSSLKSISIPDGVISIGNAAFFDCESLASIAIPDSVKFIGASAFYDCKSLTSIIIPNGVTSIGNYAFYGSSLTSIIIPESVVSIGASAFCDCASLTSIYIPSAVIYIGASAFKKCTSLNLIEIDEGNKVYDSRNSCNAIIETATNTLIVGCGNTNIPSDIVSIASDAFYGCLSFGSITIPSGVTSIGDYAFFGSLISGISIPSSVVSIGDQAFSNCNFLASMKVESGNKIYDSREDCNAIIETATNTLISGCKNTVIPSSVASIGDYAFYGSLFTSISIPSSVTSIGDYAFFDCDILISIAIPSSVTFIGKGAFCSCDYLVSVTIAGEEISIGDNAFSMCVSLTYVNIPDDVISIGEYVFSGCESLNYARLGGLAYLGNAANPYLILCSIYDRTITDATVQEGIKYIMKGVFDECRSLVSIDLPSTLTAIGDEAFSGCASLSSISIPTGVTSIGTAAFFGCDSLASVSISGNEVSIGESAFLDCQSLVSLSFLNKAVSIGENAFSRCESLVSVSLSGDAISVGEGAFSGCDSLASVSISGDTISLGDDAFSFCTSLASVSISGDATYIGNCVFSGCLSLSSVVIPANITGIGLNAFNGYSKLLKIYYAGTPEQWDEIPIYRENSNLAITARYYFTSNGADETEPGNWWYYDAEDNIVEKVVEAMNE